MPEGVGPHAIRAALLAEERADFDQAYRWALAEAAETLELAGVLDTLEHWRYRAIMSADPQAYRRMLRRAAHLLSGEDVPKEEQEQVAALPAEVLSAYAEVRST